MTLISCSNCGKYMLSEADMYVYQHRPSEEYISCGCKEFTNFDAVRNVLEREISSKQKSVDRLVKNNALEAAARENAVKEGVSWALFVLYQEYNKRG